MNTEEFSPEESQIVEYLLQRQEIFFKRKGELQLQLLKEMYGSRFWAIAPEALITPNVCGYTANAIRDALATVFSRSGARTVHGHYTKDGRYHYWTQTEGAHANLFIDASHGQFDENWEERFLIKKGSDVQTVGLREYMGTGGNEDDDGARQILAENKGRLPVEKWLKEKRKIILARYYLLFKSVLS